MRLRAFVCKQRLHFLVGHVGEGLRLFLCLRQFLVGLGGEEETHDRFETGGGRRLLCVGHSSSASIAWRMYMR